ncbi:hypothetical protein [Photobacterium indicum]|uniref:Uncharacterized protein n=1 Tax=Photobacterium indicum TaxID=81447 RepID=A0A2T3L2T8_9GAMM|nr:hypothetical protein [Photobacterium indicum]PSV43181.1 hypothetical protein C9J47_23655 [Photobacterium indicum]
MKKVPLLLRISVCLIGLLAFDLSLARDAGVGRPEKTYDREADVTFVNRIGRNHCYSFNKIYPLFSDSTKSMTYSREICRLEVDKPKPGWLSINAKKGYGPAHKDAEFTRLDSETTFTAPLDQLNPQISLGLWSGFFTLECLSDNCININGWGDTATGPNLSQTKRIKFDDLKKSSLDVSLAMRYRDTVKVIRALSRLISPDHSDQLVCEKLKCRN